MPGLSGLELAAELRQRGSTARVIILTTFARPGYLRRALDAGASGYLLKDAPSHRLADAIRRVHGGGRAVDPELAAEAWSESDPLTDRERQVLRLAAEGQAGAEIAEQLELSEGTVRNYLSEAISKLGAKNRVEAGADRAREGMAVVLELQQHPRRRHERHQRLHQLLDLSVGCDEPCAVRQFVFPVTFIISTNSVSRLLVKTNVRVARRSRRA